MELMIVCRRWTIEGVSDVNKENSLALLYDPVLLGVGGSGQSDLCERWTCFVQIVRKTEIVDYSR